MQGLFVYTIKCSDGNEFELHGFSELMNFVFLHGYRVPTGSSGFLPLRDFTEISNYPIKLKQREQDGGKEITIFVDEKHTQQQ